MRSAILIRNLRNPLSERALNAVDIDAEFLYSWIPAKLLNQLGIAPARVQRFEPADNALVERQVGFALVGVGGRSAPTPVVFALAGEPAPSNVVA